MTIMPVLLISLFVFIVLAIFVSNKTRIEVIVFAIFLLLSGGILLSAPDLRGSFFSGFIGLPLLLIGFLTGIFGFFKKD